jgi:hypothetical protein
MMAQPHGLALTGIRISIKTQRNSRGLTILAAFLQLEIKKVQMQSARLMDVMAECLRLLIMMG